MSSAPNTLAAIATATRINCIKNFGDNGAIKWYKWVLGVTIRRRVCEGCRLGTVLGKVRFISQKPDDNSLEHSREVFRLFVKG